MFAYWLVLAHYDIPQKLLRGNNNYDSLLIYYLGIYQDNNSKINSWSPNSETKGTTYYIDKLIQKNSELLQLKFCKTN